MNSKRIQLLLIGVAAWISLLLMITTTYGASIVIGGNYTDIGTIVIVSPKPGDTPQNNGTALLNNLADITADVNNPYLIKLGPGIYDIGTNSLQMKQFVDIEGSGEKTTKITGATSYTDFPPTTATIQGASNAELRFLTVENTGTGFSTVALLNSSASPSIFHVTATASGGSYNIGVFNYFSSPTMTNVTATGSGGTGTVGVANNSSSPTMTNVTATGSGGTAGNTGVGSYASSPTMTDVTATASGGSANYGVDTSGSGTVKINHSVLKATTTIYNGLGVTTRVANTQMDGILIVNQGTLTCIGVYDGNYTALTSSCVKPL